MLTLSPSRLREGLRSFPGPAAGRRCPGTAQGSRPGNTGATAGRPPGAPPVRTLAGKNLPGRAAPQNPHREHPCPQAGSPPGPGQPEPAGSGAGPGGTGTRPDAATGLPAAQLSAQPAAPVAARRVGRSRWLQVAAVRTARSYSAHRHAAHRHAPGPLVRVVRPRFVRARFVRPRSGRPSSGPAGPSAAGQVGRSGTVPAGVSLPGVSTVLAAVVPRGRGAGVFGRALALDLGVARWRARRPAWGTGGVGGTPARLRRTTTRPIGRTYGRGEMRPKSDNKAGKDAANPTFAQRNPLTRFFAERQLTFSARHSPVRKHLLSTRTFNEKSLWLWRH